MLFDNISLEQKLPPTPTTAPTATPYPHVEIYVNEVLSQPNSDWNGDGSVDVNDEWVELYNRGDSDVDLDEWVIDDGPGGSDPFMLRSLFIRSDGYFVLFSSATGLRLNDSGDQVRLYRNDGALADDLQVPPLDPDQSVGRYPDGESELSTDWLPTLGKPNGSQGKTPRPTPEPTNTPLPTATPEPTQTPRPTSTPKPSATPEPTSTPAPLPPLVSIAGARDEAPGEMVRVRGHVSAPSHLVGARRLYVQDGTGGVLVAVPEEQQGPDLGALIEVTGLTGTYYGERALRDGHDLRVLGGGALPHPLEVSTGKVGPLTEGRLVRVTGTVTSASKPSVQLDDGSGEARVRVAPSTGIEWPSPRKHDTLQVVGVVSSFNGAFRVLPRYADDLQLTRTEAEAPEPRPATIQQARAAPEGELLQIEGTVTAPPGPLGESRFWIQDDTGGIPVTRWQGAPRLEPGDRVRATGHSGSAYGERLLRSEAGGIARLGRGERLEPARISLSQVGAGAEGQLVQVEGAVARSAWPSIYLAPPFEAQPSGTMRVYARESAALDNPHASRGDTLRAVGIVSSYEGAYRLLPFQQSHLRVTQRSARDSEQEYSAATVAQARAAPEGSDLLIEGRVTAPSGLLGQGLMYVQDETAGILVTGSPSGIRLGDVVRVAGETGTYYSERRIKAGSAAVVRGGAPPSPRNISTRAVGPSTEGLLIALQGTVASSSWPTLQVGEPPARVRVRESTGVANPRAGRGDRARAVGIVNRRGDRYSVLPRFTTDLRIEHAVNAPAPREGAAPREADRGWRNVTLAEARTVALGTRVRFEAQVTAPPGVLGESRVYVGDQHTGVALHLVGGGYPVLAEGDRVEVRGKTDTYHGERIVRLETGEGVLRLGPGVPLSGVPIRTGEVGAKTEGRLVSIRAPITGRQWPTLYLNDGSGQTRARVLESTLIPRLEGGKGDLATVVGLVSQWDGRFRLLPRWRRDIEITIVPRIPLTGGGGTISRDSLYSTTHRYYPR